MLQGTRVLLRPMTQEDVPIQHSYFQDFTIQVLNGGLPHVSPIERSQELLEGFSKKDSGFDGFAIDVDGDYIGFCSLRHVKDYPGYYHLGVVIGNRNYWEKGYGSEVVNLLLHHGFHYLGARKIGLITNAKNPRAIKCFLSCGFVEEGRCRKVKWINGEYTDIVEMGMLKEEWESYQVKQ